MLPLIVTVCLPRGARAMVSGKAIVRRLDAIETLGGMDVLCVDKTGTPTSGVIKLDRAQSMSGLNSSYVLHAADKGLRTFSWRLSERFLVCSVLRSVRGRWSYTSQRR